MCSSERGGGCDTEDWDKVGMHVVPTAVNKAERDKQVKDTWAAEVPEIEGG